MFLESRRDVRWYLPLAVTGGALIVTHHLSTYFFVLGALGGLLLLELWRPALWRRRFPTRELAFLGAFITATLAFWFYGTYSFVKKVLLPGLGHSSLVGFAALEGAGILAVLATGVLIHLRRRRFAPRRAWVRLPSDRSVLRDAVLLAVGIFGGIALLLVVPLPGTTQTTAPAAILMVRPRPSVGRPLCGEPSGVDDLSARTVRSHLARGPRRVGDRHPSRFRTGRLAAGVRRGDPLRPGTPSTSSYHSGCWPRWGRRASSLGSIVARDVGRP